MNKELEKKAEKWALKRTGRKNLLWNAYCLAYIAGATENGIVWHDLRKNPEDLPKDKEFKITDKGNIGFYDSHWEKWYYWNSNEMIFPPIAWCEIPKLTEE